MLANFHTHTVWCDGKDTPEAMTLAAIGKGFSRLGFSSHLAFPEGGEGVLDPVRAMDYVRDVRRVAAKYAGQIEVYCGGEADYIPGATTPEKSRYAELGLDYLIGSVHYAVADDGARVPVDDTPDLLERGIAEHFGGSGRKLVERYFEQQVFMVGHFDFDVLGHPDLVRKFNEKRPWFDEAADWYVALEERLAQALAASGKVTEVNTGAISRGWLSDAYPSARFRETLRKYGVKFILSSDAHSAAGLDCAFDRFGGQEKFLIFPLDKRQ
jgi:histidinol-phosphatase (PHP family)